ncbi:mucin-5AC-like [Mercenaria mercenaria]|uniref:mucin-5AC-like n=1 Tax=Mercenaria mercenaria TaxID=6596 RepID=UPI00234FA610|nr:mucin-5AC-like [Mercenaria mercenaria]
MAVSNWEYLFIKTAAPTSATQQGTAGTTLVPGSIPTQGAQTTVSGGAAPASAAPVSATQQVTAGTTFAARSAATQRGWNAVATGFIPLFRCNQHLNSARTAEHTRTWIYTLHTALNTCQLHRTSAAMTVATGLFTCFPAAQLLATQQGTAGTTLVPGSIPTQAAQTTVSGGAAPASAAPVFLQLNNYTTGGCPTQYATWLSPASAAPTSPTQQETIWNDTRTFFLYLHKRLKTTVTGGAAPAITAPISATQQVTAETTFAPGSAATQTAAATTVATGVSPASAAPTSATQQGTAGTTLVPGSISTQEAQTTVSGGAAPTSATPVSATQQVTAGTTFAPGSAATQTAAATAVATGLSPASAAPVSATQQVTAGTTFAPGSAATQTAAAMTVATGLSPASAAPTSATQQGTAGTTLVPGYPIPTHKRTNDMTEGSTYITATTSFLQQNNCTNFCNSARNCWNDTRTWFYTYTSGTNRRVRMAAPTFTTTSFLTEPSNCWNNIPHLGFLQLHRRDATTSSNWVYHLIQPHPASATQQGPAGTTLVPVSYTNTSGSNDKWLRRGSTLLQLHHYSPNATSYCLEQPSHPSHYTDGGCKRQYNWVSPLHSTNFCNSARNSGTTLLPGSYTYTSAQTTVSGGAAPASAAPVSATQQVTAGTTFAHRFCSQRRRCNGSSNCGSPALQTAPPTFCNSARNSGTTLLPVINTYTSGSKRTVSGGLNTYAAATTVATGASPASAAPTSATQQGTAGTTPVSGFSIPTQALKLQCPQRATPCFSCTIFCKLKQVTLGNNIRTRFWAAKQRRAAATTSTLGNRCFSCTNFCHSARNPAVTTLVPGSYLTQAEQTTVSEGASSYFTKPFLQRNSNCWNNHSHPQGTAGTNTLEPVLIPTQAAQYDSVIGAAPYFQLHQFLQLNKVTAWGTTIFAPLFLQLHIRGGSNDIQHWGNHLLQQHQLLQLTRNCLETTLRTLFNTTQAAQTTVSGGAAPTSATPLSATEQVTAGTTFTPGSAATQRRLPTTSSNRGITLLSHQLRNSKEHLERHSINWGITCFRAPASANSQGTAGTTLVPGSIPTQAEQTTVSGGAAPTSATPVSATEQVTAGTTFAPGSAATQTAAATTVATGVSPASAAPASATQQGTAGTTLLHRTAGCNDSSTNCITSSPHQLLQLTRNLLERPLVPGSNTTQAAQTTVSGGAAPTSATPLSATEQVTAGTTFAPGSAATQTAAATTVATGVSPASAAPTSATQQGTAGTTLVPGSIPTQAAQTTVSRGSAPASLQPFFCNSTSKLLKHNIRLRPYTHRLRLAHSTTGHHLLQLHQLLQLQQGTCWKTPLDLVLYLHKRLNDNVKEKPAQTHVKRAAPASAAPVFCNSTSNFWNEHSTLLHRQAAQRQIPTGYHLLPAATNTTNKDRWNDTRLPVLNTYLNGTKNHSVRSSTSTSSVHPFLQLNKLTAGTTFTPGSAATQTAAATTVATGVSPASAAPASATQQGTAGTTLVPGSIPTQAAQTTVSGGAAPTSATPVSATQQVTAGTTFAPGSAATQTAAATTVSTGVSPASAAPASATQQGTAGTTLVPGSIPTQAAQTTVSGGAAPTSATPVSATQQVTAGTTFAPGSAATQTAACNDSSTGYTCLQLHQLLQLTRKLPEHTSVPGSIPKQACLKRQFQRGRPLPSLHQFFCNSTSNCWNNIPPGSVTTQRRLQHRGAAPLQLINFSATQQKYCWYNIPPRFLHYTFAATTVATGYHRASAAPTSTTPQGTAGTTLVPGTIPTQAAQSTVSGGAAPASAAPVSATQQVTAGTTLVPGTIPTHAAVTTVSGWAAPASAALTSATVQGITGTTFIPGSTAALTTSSVIGATTASKKTHAFTTGVQSGTANLLFKSSN